MAELGVEPRNAVRFAFWGAEESGLIGSQHYVDSLTRQQLNDIEVYLNFDMVGSPNFVRFVYDGDGSAFGIRGPSGSGHVEDTFVDFFASQNLESEPTAFDGRSDYDAFINAGIPAGGLFTGAEGIKTAAQVADYGGTAGVAYDPCYHLACDTFANVSLTGLDQMSDAIAHATLVYAMTTSDVNGTGKASSKAAEAQLEFHGNLRIR
jgi:Zn-dependent M28 family amino/carboxypeptidase